MRLLLFARQFLLLTASIGGTTNVCGVHRDISCGMACATRSMDAVGLAIGMAALNAYRDTF